MEKADNILRLFGFLVIGAIIILIGLELFQLITQKNITGKSISSSQTSASPLPSITKQNLANYLQNQEIIKELPEKAVIELKFYNFDSGERQFEEIYTIKKSSVEQESAENPDLTVSMHSKYIPLAYNLCNAVKKAKENQDVSFELHLSKAKFLWKYKGLLEYKECFGF